MDSIETMFQPAWKYAARELTVDDMVANVDKIYEQLVGVNE
jgi:hypothetical protein